MDVLFAMYYITSGSLCWIGGNVHKIDNIIRIKGILNQR